MRKRIVLALVLALVLASLAGSVEAGPRGPRPGRRVASRQAVSKQVTRPSAARRPPRIRPNNGKPDLVVTGLQTYCQRISSSSCPSGYQWKCYFWAQVKNQGDVSTGTGFDVWVYYAGRREQGKPKTVPVGYLHFPALGPGEVAEQGQWFNNVACAVQYTGGPYAGLWGMVHWGVQTCVKRAGAYADPPPPIKGDIAEGNENNNYKRVPLTPCAPEGSVFVIPPSGISRGHPQMH